MPLDLSADYLIFDNPVAITIRDVDTAAETAVDKAVRRELTTREVAASRGKYLTGDVRYHVPQALYTASPHVGDKVIESDSSLWTVLEVSRSTLATRWALVTRNLVIAGNLTELVTIQQMTVSKGTHGEPIVTWADVEADVSARLQPTDASVQEDKQRRMTSYRATVYFAEEYSLDDTHRIVHGSDYWRVVATRKPERIDALFEVDVSRDVFPI